MFMAVAQTLALKHLPPEGQPRLGAVGLRSALNQLVDQLLDDGQSAPSEYCRAHPLSADLAPPDAPAGCEEVETALRSWIEGLGGAFREVHPTAIEIVALRRDGFQDRDIAERLKLPLRLVRRIMVDVQAAWRQWRES
jgi:hypothetical protein